MATTTAAQQMTAYDNFGDGRMKFGTEEAITDFITLDSGNRTGKLPKSFTICSSVWIKFKTTNILFFQIYDSKRPWFAFQFGGTANFISNGSIFHGGSSLVIGDGNWILPLDGKILVSSHSWTHGCLSLNSISGEFIMVINGVIIYNDILNSFVNSGTTGM